MIDNLAIVNNVESVWERTVSFTGLVVKFVGKESPYDTNKNLFITQSEYFMIKL